MENEFYINEIGKYKDPLPDAIEQSLHIITPKDENGDCEELYISIKRTQIKRGEVNVDNRKKNLIEYLNYKVGSEEVVLSFMNKFFKGIFNITK